MDNRRFDALTRSMGQGSRRRVMTGFGALVASTLAGAIAAPHADAKKGKGHHHHKSCRKLGEFCKSGCGGGPCESCCTGWCGFDELGDQDYHCCVGPDKPCPSGCQPNQDCQHCCSQYCRPNGTCF
jgi:hypothetical protein